MTILLPRREAIKKVAKGVAGIAGLVLTSTGLLTSTLAEADTNSWSVLGTTTWPTPSWGWANLPWATFDMGQGSGAVNVTNGNRTGAPKGTSSGFWVAPTSGSPYVIVELRNPQSPTETIDTINVYSVQDNYPNVVDPSDTLTCSLYGLVDFAVYGRINGTWIWLKNITGNNLVKRKITFSTITVDAVLVQVTRTMDAYTRIAAIEVMNVAGTTSVHPRDVAATIYQTKTTGNDFLLQTQDQAQILQSTLQGRAWTISATRTKPGPSQSFTIVPKTTQWHSMDDGAWFGGPSLDFSFADNAFNDYLQSAIQNPSGLASAVMWMGSIVPAWVTDPLGLPTLAQEITPSMADYLASADATTAFQAAISDEIAVLEAAAAATAATAFFGTLTAGLIGLGIGTMLYNYSTTDAGVRATDQWNRALVQP